MTIYNFTMHAATPDQIKAGVSDLIAKDKEILKKILDFKELPTKEVLKDRVHQLIELMDEVATKGRCSCSFMIGGAPFFMDAIAKFAPERMRTRCFFAFSKRETLEFLDEEGFVQKRSVFKHEGFVPLL